MSRLTTKIDNEYIVGVSVGECGWTDVAEEKQYEANQKLGKLEDLEEQIGCPLEVVFKALKNGIYYEDVANNMRYMVADLHYNLAGDFVLYFDDEECLLARNYKKTWWLKKDKSE